MFYREVFRILQKIYDETFFGKMFNGLMFDRVLNNILFDFALL